MRVMKHRHLNTTDWTRAAIDSALEYGDLADWRELFAAARHDRGLAHRVLDVAIAHQIDGSSVLAQTLIEALWPDLVAVREPAA